LLLAVPVSFEYVHLWGTCPEIRPLCSSCLWWPGTRMPLNMNRKRSWE